MNILSEIIRGVWMIEPSYAHQYFPLVHKLLMGDFVSAGIKDQDPLLSLQHDIYASKINTINAYTLYRRSDLISGPSIFSLDMVGPITKYDQYCGPVGMQAMASWLQKADAHPMIYAHLIRIDSGGGEGYAMRYMANAIKNLTKPVCAFVDGHAASAAYGIAAACSFVAASDEMDRLGSIGTYVTIADYTQWYEQQGIQVQEIYADKSKDKNAEYYQAIQGDVSLMKTLVNKYNEFFLDMIQSSRKNAGLKEQSTWGTGKMFFAREAEQIGLIDAILPYEELLQHIHLNYSPK